MKQIYEDLSDDTDFDIIDLDDIPDDAAEFIAAQKSAGTAQPEA